MTVSTPSPLCRCYRLAPEANEKITQCITATTLEGNLLRGRTIVDTAWLLSQHSLTESQITDVGTFGSLVELFNAAYVIWDDIMDGSSTRRGEPCWYRRENVGMAAINDGCLVKSSIYVILKQRFRSHPAYLDLLELFLDASLQTELGQHCDGLASASVGQIEIFTWAQYGFITAKKTAYYSFYLPLTIPLLYLNMAMPGKLKEIYDVSMLMGLVFQARDDYLDVYGDATVTGKIGTDIQEHRCSWLSVQAVLLCNEEQKRVLRESYGRDDPEDVERVKKVFEEVDLPKRFREWNGEMLDKLDAKVEEMTDAVVRDSIRALLAKYFKDPRRHLPQGK
ncbi:isoprenoid synthase domain-containing protein [Aspergillus crustosus]